MAVDPTSINANITTNIAPNGVGRITAAILQSVLLAIIVWCVANFAPLNNPAFTGTVSFPAGTVAANMSIIDPRAWNMSASNQSTTGNLPASSPLLTLASAKDFANNQGIRINHAGAAFGLNQPTSCTATPGGTPGTTTYQYEIAAIDAAGGVGAATATFQTSTGNATLSVLNYISIACAAPSGTAPAGYAVYRYTGSAYTLVGFISNSVPTYYDMGYGVSAVGAPDYVPTTAPTGSLADWLVTTIASGGGTNSLTLATAGLTTATAAGVYHDDTAAFNVAVSQAQLSNDNSLFIPPGTINVTGLVPISSSGFRMEGFGWNSIVNRINPTGDLFAYSVGKVLSVDFTVTANALQSSGYLFNLGPVGNGTLRGIRTYGGPNIVGNTGGSQNVIVEFVFNNYTLSGISWLNASDASDFVANGTMFVEPQITLGHPESRGLDIEGGLTYNISHVNIGGQDNPCYIKPLAGTLLTDLDITHVECDSQGIVGPTALGSNAWTIDGTNAGATLRDVRCTHCWAGAMPGDGFYVNNTDTFSCAACQSASNRKNGFNIINSQDVILSAVHAFGNSYANPGAYDGIYVDGASGEVTISGGLSGINRQLSTPTQRYGVNVAVGAYKVGVCGMVMNGNVTSGYYINGVTTTPSCGNY